MANRCQLFFGCRLKHCGGFLFGFRMAIAMLVVIGDTNDEGRCPVGQYPIRDQGVGRDTPIPGAGGAAREPEPAGQWHKTWGSIASSNATADAERQTAGLSLRIGISASHGWFPIVRMGLLAPL